MKPHRSINRRLFIKPPRPAQLAAVTQAVKTRESELAAREAMTMRHADTNVAARAGDAERGRRAARKRYYCIPSEPRWPES